MNRRRKKTDPVIINGTDISNDKSRGEKLILSLLSKTLIWIYLFFLILWAFLWKDHLPYYIDAALYAYPDHWVNLEAFSKGLLPLWNPYIGCGSPHLANWQSACLYPPFWIFNLTGLSNSLMWMALLHTGVAFFGFYLWLRRQKIDPIWCALGALSFSGSAHLTRCLNNLPFITTAAWIPWVFWSAQRALENLRPQNWFRMALLLGLEVLAGYPIFTFYTLVFLVVWFEYKKPSAPTRFRFWITLIATAFITCVQWLPFLELLTYAKPDTWTPYPYFDRPQDYLSLLKPDILGLLGSTSYQGAFPNGNFNLYFGLFPLLLFFLNLLFLSRLSVRFWTLCSAVWFLWLAGAYFPLWRLIPLPLLQWLEPSKAVGLFLFCVLTSVCLTLEDFFKTRAVTPPLGLTLLLVLLWIFDIGRIPFLLLHPMPDPYQQSNIRNEAQKIAVLCKGERILSLHTPSEMQFTGTRNHALEKTFDLQTESFLSNSNAVWGLRSADRYLFLQVEGSENLMKYFNKGFPYNGSLLDVAGVRLFLLSQILPAPKYSVVDQYNEDWINLNSQASSDVRWVGDKEVYPNRVLILNALLNPGNDWKSKIYLEKDSNGTYISLAPVLRDRPLGASTQIGYERESAGRISLREDFVRPGFVVLNETYAPGWHAWIDGKPAPILRAYGLFMGVAVPGEKEGQVDIRYEPASFRLGLFISFLSLILLGAWIFRPLGVLRQPGLI